MLPLDPRLTLGASHKVFLAHVLVDVAPTPIRARYHCVRLAAREAGMAVEPGVPLLLAVLCETTWLGRHVVSEAVNETLVARPFLLKTLRWPERLDGGDRFRRHGEFRAGPGVE